MLVIHRKLFEDYPHWKDQHCWCDPTYIEEPVEVENEGGTFEVPSEIRTDIVVDYQLPPPLYLH